MEGQAVKHLQYASKAVPAQAEGEKLIFNKWEPGQIIGKVQDQLDRGNGQYENN